MNGIVYDTGSRSNIANCFPVRSCSNFTNNDGGAWVLERDQINDDRINASKLSPLTYDDIKKERRRSDKTNSTMNLKSLHNSDVRLQQSDSEISAKLLDGFFLMKKFCIDDPSDLCSMNISCENLCDVTSPDLAMFDNVAYVNAAENKLNLDHFSSFQTLRELELPLNQIRRINLKSGCLPNLEMLDLSYNNVDCESLSSLGNLPNLKVLHLTGNALEQLPASLSGPVAYREIQGESQLFQNLEILLLDNNLFKSVDVFASLAALKNLKHLNLSKNQLYAVPQLMLIKGIHVPCNSAPFANVATTTPGNNEPSPTAGKPHANQTASPGNQAKESAVATTTAVDVATKLESQLMADTTATDSRANPGEDTDKEFAQLDLNKLDEKIESDHLEQMEAESVDDQNDTPTRMPFSELRYLDLSHNLVLDEQNLLAVSTWPVLSELILFDNPFLNRKSYLPHLLKFFLSEQLGIRIQRKPTDNIPKPQIEISQKEKRKIKSFVSSIPKCNVEELLAIEYFEKKEMQEICQNKEILAIQAPHDVANVGPEMDETGAASPVPLLPSPPSSFPRANTLPPLSSEKITSESANPPSSAGARRQTSSRSPEKDHRSLRAGQSTDISHTEDKEEEQEEQGETTAATANAFFFMTEPEDQHEETQKFQEEKEEDLSAKLEVDSKPVKPVDDRYKGYELLLDIDESLLEQDMPKDLHGNVRALHYMLEHPLHYTDNNINLLRRSHKLQPRRKVNLNPLKHTRKDKETANRLASMLTQMRERSCVVEMPLSEALKQQHTTCNGEFSNAKQLLAQVQHKYSAVRENSKND